ncbi:hypothetical protein [Fodinibius salsisoli]|uniref:Uncharacterized protein n=1 Tax=Fodinibius salsisoli TaxID=2820877 RepID=A0ABT3PS91_9BACT|nr:hypothetical protein [Fodinibius salsisoli]MCW9708727.1 hypothetical protein [Fodinibius salsisoli]
MISQGLRLTFSREVWRGLALLPGNDPSHLSLFFVFHFLDGQIPKYRDQASWNSKTHRLVDSSGACRAATSGKNGNSSWRTGIQTTIRSAPRCSPATQHLHNPEAGGNNAFKALVQKQNKLSLRARRGASNVE